MMTDKETKKDLLKGLRLLTKAVKEPGLSRKQMAYIRRCMRAIAKGMPNA